MLESLCSMVQAATSLTHMLITYTKRFLITSPNDLTGIYHLCKTIGKKVSWAHIQLFKSCNFKIRSCHCSIYR